MSAHADIPGLSSSMEFVTIGAVSNAGNSFVYGEVSYSDLGAVDHYYKIGVKEVSESQWDLFTADVGSPWTPAGVEYGGVYSWGANAPVVHVSWYEAAQFCNWLTSGSATNGAYQFDGAGGAFSGIDRAAAELSFSSVFVLPSQDEWYKAAYYDTLSADFTLYANGTDDSPIHGVDSNLDALESEGWPVWDVGSGTEEQNGTFDMMGNVWEWLEGALDGELSALDENRDIRGGSAHGPDYASSVENYFNTGYAPEDTTSWLGFRVAVVGSDVVPEPTSVALILVAGGMLIMMKHWMSRK